jgi:hypothetical protein
MGPVHAIFKADGDETRGRYAIAAWFRARSAAASRTANAPRRKPRGRGRRPARTSARG